MRITGGVAAGIVLDAPKGRAARPTADRAKEALFASLAAARVIENATVVDLFAGTGALGLDAASRGAARVFLVERSGHHAELVLRNAAKVAKAGARAEIVALKGDALTAHRRLPAIAGKIDLILADPPYADSKRHLSRLLKSADFAEWAGNALLVWEIPEDFKAEDLPENTRWNVDKRVKLGGACFLWISRTELADGGV
jgi:16S rRNA (guanine966-N2)-methyltransferase